MWMAVESGGAIIIIEVIVKHWLPGADSKAESPFGIY